MRVEEMFVDVKFDIKSKLDNQKSRKRWRLRLNSAADAFYLFTHSAKGNAFKTENKYQCSAYDEKGKLLMKYYYDADSSSTEVSIDNENANWFWSAFLHGIEAYKNTFLTYPNHHFKGWHNATEHFDAVEREEGELL